MQPRSGSPHPVTQKQPSSTNNRPHELNLFGIGKFMVSALGMLTSSPGPHDTRDSAALPMLSELCRRYKPARESEGDAGTLACKRSKNVAQERCTVLWVVRKMQARSNHALI